MKRDLGMAFALMVCGVVYAADPPVPAASRPPAAAQAPARTTPVTAPSKPPTKPAAKPLDLRIGDVHKYMMPRDFQTALRTPDADSMTVVVEGRRELAPMKMEGDVPMGLASLWYAAKDPKNSWRLLAPVVGVQDGPTVDKVPPPIFRWGP
jgi:hypothetical protein